MRTILLIAHVFAAVLCIGPATVATSVFPRYADADGLPVAALLHRISRVYGTGSIAVAVFGVAMALQQDRFGEIWVDVSLTLFVAATVVLLALVVPAEGRILRALDATGPAERPPLRPLVLRIRAGAAVYALLWLVILVLMIAKP
jgi:hypothetical protein